MLLQTVASCRAELSRGATTPVHRRLLRYRIAATDGIGASVRVPYFDDPQPNFAYFCYDGVPAWSAAAQPGVTPVETFSSELLESIPVYHLIASGGDVTNCQYNGSFRNEICRRAPPGLDRRCN